MGMFTATSHPFVAGFHFFWKLITVACYLLIPLLLDDSNLIMVVVILAAIDFWFVKNVAGRLLAGLRWWIDFN